MKASEALARLASGVLCVGFDGATVDSAPVDALRELEPGGLILFDRNVGDVEVTHAFVAELAQAIASSRSAPFVAIDQEGGRVARLRRGAHEIPSMMALGATGDVALTERVGRLIASDLRRIGVTVDFAPVLDLAGEPASGVVGTRSFGDDPARVAALGVALAHGLERGGVTATFKHFPGHGATALDSHLSLPVIDLDGATLRRHLAPFATAIASGARAIMVGHLVVRTLDAGTPATLSRAVVDGLLRRELGFEGVCFSDCMEMSGVANGVGTERAAALAIAAGVDCVVVSHSLARAFGARDAIVAAVERGEITEERLREAFGRTAALASPLHADDVVDDGAAERAARSAITVVRSDSAGVQPFAKNEAVTMVSFEGERGSGAETGRDRASANLALRERGVRSELLRVDADPDADTSEALASFCAGQRPRRFVFLTRSVARHPAQRVALEALLDVAPDATVVALAEPFDALALPRARTVLCTYGEGAASIDALADVLIGRSAATGTLPVSLERACPAPG